MVISRSTISKYKQVEDFRIHFSELRAHYLCNLLNKAIQYDRLRYYIRKLSKFQTIPINHFASDALYERTHTILNNIHSIKHIRVQ